MSHCRARSKNQSFTEEELRDLFHWDALKETADMGRCMKAASAIKSERFQQRYIFWEREVIWSVCFHPGVTSSKRHSCFQVKVVNYHILNIDLFLLQAHINWVNLAKIEYLPGGCSQDSHESNLFECCLSGSKDPENRQESRNLENILYGPT